MVSLLLVSTACNSVSKERDKVLKIRQELYDKNSVLSSQVVAEKAIVAFRKFGTDFPKDSSALKFHTEAAEIAWSLGKFPQSLEIFKEIIELHPDAASMPYLYLRVAAISNDALKDTVEARKYYTLVLEQYPGSEFRKGAEFGLETLGLNEQEQFDYMMKKAGNQEPVVQSEKAN